MPTLGYRNNNPGNLKRDTNSTPYKGEIVPPKEPPFRWFESMEHGYRAMYHLLIIRYLMDWRLNTLEKILYKYAPPFENDTEAYINYVSDRLGIARNALISINNETLLFELGLAISRYENGIEPTRSQALAGFNMLKNDILLDFEGIMNEANPKDSRNALIIIGSSILLLSVFLLGKKSKNTKEKQPW